MKRTRTYKKVLSKIPAKRIAIDSHLVLYIGKDTCQSCLWLTVTPNQLLYSYSLRMACNHRLIEDAIPRTRNRREKQQQKKKEDLYTAKLLTFGAFRNWATSCPYPPAKQRPTAATLLSSTLTVRAVYRTIRAVGPRTCVARCLRKNGGKKMERKKSTKTHEKTPLPLLPAAPRRRWCRISI